MYTGSFSTTARYFSSLATSPAAAAAATPAQEAGEEM